MAAESLVFVAFLLLAALGPLVLWRLVESERDAGPEMDRNAAEHSARRDDPSRER